MTNFVGTGTFQFVERVPDRYVQLRRFEEYTLREEQADNYGGRRVAYLDELRFVPVPDASTRLQGAIAGQFVDYVDALPVENAPQLKGSKRRRSSLGLSDGPSSSSTRNRGPLTKCYAPSRRSSPR